jgi:putrescine importer
VVLIVGVITALNAWSINSTSNVNFALVGFAMVMIVVFVVLALGQLADGVGQGTVLTSEPLFHHGVQAPEVLTGATVVCFSFIGFDAITMYTEEARDRSAVPKAIVLTLLIGGAVFLVGGKLFQVLFVSAAFAATVASGLSSHASVSRLLHVMGRNRVLPERVFGYVHPTRRTPVYAVVFVGLVSLLAITPSLELVSSMINFGALTAFSFVNICVIALFAVRRREVRTVRQVTTNLVLPLIGFGLTGLLWAHLHHDALVTGLTWTAIGIAYAVVLRVTSGTRLSDFELDLNDNLMEVN